MADNDSMFDKMVEMGMGMAMVNQIPRMMGAVMPDLSGNGQQTPPPVNNGGSFQVYAIINNAQAGPFSEQEFISLIQSDKVNTSTLIWKPGMKSWLPAQQVPEAGKLFLLYGTK